VILLKPWDNVCYIEDYTVLGAHGILEFGQPQRAIVEWEEDAVRPPLLLMSAKVTRPFRGGDIPNESKKGGHDDDDNIHTSYPLNAVSYPSWLGNGFTRDLNNGRMLH